MSEYRLVWSGFFVIRNACTLDCISVTRFGKIPSLWQIFKKKLAIYLRFIWFWAQFSTHFGAICMLLGKSHCWKWPNIENTIWSPGHTGLHSNLSSCSVWVLYSAICNNDNKPKSIKIAKVGSTIGQMPNLLSKLWKTLLTLCKSGEFFPNRFRLVIFPIWYSYFHDPGPTYLPTTVCVQSLKQIIENLYYYCFQFSNFDFSSNCYYDYFSLLERNHFRNVIFVLIQWDQMLE